MERLTIVNSYLPQWLVDSGTILGIVGFFITIWLLWEAKQIRNSFIRRARLPEVIRELKNNTKLLSTHLKYWESEEKEAVHQLRICKALIESLIPKLPDNAQKSCKTYVKSISPITFFYWRFGSSDIGKDKAWELYGQLSEIVTMLHQLDKDSKWD